MEPQRPRVDRKVLEFVQAHTFCLREMDHDAQAICGPRHARGRGRQAHRWGKTNGKIAFQGGKVDIERRRRGAAEVHASAHAQAANFRLAVAFAGDVPARAIKLRDDAAGEGGTNWAAGRHTDVGKRVDV
jgi:hypothetical protein